MQEVRVLYYGSKKSPLHTPVTACAHQLCGILLCKSLKESLKVSGSHSLKECLWVCVMEPPAQPYSQPTAIFSYCGQWNWLNALSLMSFRDANPIQCWPLETAAKECKAGCSHMFINGCQWPHLPSEPGWVGLPAWALSTNDLSEYHN